MTGQNLYRQFHLCSSLPFDEIKDLILYYTQCVCVRRRRKCSLPCGGLSDAVKASIVIPQDFGERQLELPLSFWVMRGRLARNAHNLKSK